MGLFNRKQVAVVETLNADSEETLSRAYSGRSELRHHNQVLKLVIIVMIIMYCYSQYSWTKHSNYLAEKQYVVVEIAADGKTSIKPSSLYQPKEPLDQEIRYQGGLFIYWLMSAGSKDIDRCYYEARKLLLPNLYSKFDELVAVASPTIRGLNIYRKIEDFNVKMLQREDVEGFTGEIDRYSILVTGTCYTYKEGSNEFSEKRPFAYHVRLVPLAERTDFNPSALLVKDFDAVKVKGKGGV